MPCSLPEYPYLIPAAGDSAAPVYVNCKREKYT